MWDNPSSQFPGFYSRNDSIIARIFANRGGEKVQNVSKNTDNDLGTNCRKIGSRLDESDNASVDQDHDSM